MLLLLKNIFDNKKIKEKCFVAFFLEKVKLSITFFCEWKRQKYKKGISQLGWLIYYNEINHEAKWRTINKRWIFVFFLHIVLKLRPPFITAFLVDCLWEDNEAIMHDLKRLLSCPSLRLWLLCSNYGMTFKALVVCGQCEGCDRYTINVRVVYVSKWSNSTSGDCLHSYCCVMKTIL